MTCNGNKELIFGSKQDLTDFLGDIHTPKEKRKASKSPGTENHKQSKYYPELIKEALLNKFSGWKGVLLKEEAAFILLIENTDMGTIDISLHSKGGYSYVYKCLMIGSCHSCTLAVKWMNYSKEDNGFNRFEIEIADIKMIGVILQSKEHYLMVIMEFIDYDWCSIRLQWITDLATIDDKIKTVTKMACDVMKKLNKLHQEQTTFHAENIGYIPDTDTSVLLDMGLATPKYECEEGEFEEGCNDDLICLLKSVLFMYFWQSNEEIEESDSESIDVRHHEFMDVVQTIKSRVKYTDLSENSKQEAYLKSYLEENQM